MKYTKEDVTKVEKGEWYPAGYIIGSTGFMKSHMITFKDGEKCNAHSVEDAIQWMNNPKRK